MVTQRLQKKKTTGKQMVGQLRRLERLRSLEEQGRLERIVNEKYLCAYRGRRR